jgi:Calcineurin-like phosphoesterase
MNPIIHYEAPHLALWKSCVTEVLAKAQNQAITNAGGIDSTHPMIHATDRYCCALQENQPIEKPPSSCSDQQAVETYLSYLHHRKAHARIGKNAELEADLDRQTKEFKFGNPLWQQMFVKYFEYYWNYPFHLGGKPQYRSWQSPDGGDGDLRYAVIPWKLPSNARIAIVGDIGTGTDVAAAVLSSALRQKPLAILHLGDVYFSGTEFETNHRLVGLVKDVMQSEGYHVPFFTVPGNHEYFSGAVPYLKAIDSGLLSVAPNQKQSASYFCLQTEDNGWQFLGLDTSYHGHYMSVPATAQQAALEQLHIGPIFNCQDPSEPHWPTNHNPYFPPTDTTWAPDMVRVREDELTWHLDKIKNFNGRSILLSHHQLYSALDVCGVKQGQNTDSFGNPVLDDTDMNREWVNTGLWQQFGPEFGDRIAAWIWGHEHNLGIFENNYRPKDWPIDTKEAREIYKTLPKGRCAGHSAIPVNLTEKPYLQKYPVSLQSPELKLDTKDGWYNHGFELIELAGAGKPAKMSYFQIVQNDPKPKLLYEEMIV